jgi:hypothetical protein
MSLDTNQEAILSDSELIFVKQIILRNKITSGILWRIYNEIVKYTRDLTDWVLLKNSLPSLFPSGKVCTKITWKPDPDLVPGVNVSVL